MPWITLSETLEAATPPLTNGGKNRWALQIEGDPDDIDDLAAALNGANGSGGLKVDYLGTVPVLTSNEWDEIDKSEVVQAIATAALNDCVGCLNFLNVCGFLKIGTIYERKEIGQSVLTRYSHVKVTVKKPIPDRASPAKFQAILKMAHDYEWFADCLAIYYEEPTFFSIYRAVEAIRRFCGGEPALKSRSDLNGSKLIHIKTVANHYRHSQPSSKSKPNPFYTLDECVKAVSTAIDKILNDEVKIDNIAK